jgi:hypothetical protein
MHCWSTFGVRTTHGQTRTHKTHHYPNLRGSHHLPPYSILCASPRGPHPNGILSWDSQMGVPKFSKLGFRQLCRAITLCVDLRSRWGFKQSCSPRWERFNGTLHGTCTQGNQVDSRLLMVRSQITNPTFDPSFGHNLRLRCPNGSCEPTSDIYIARAF